ncbi:MAG: CBS domain-containing protein [Saprospiraceae bacterium]|nr:CBS domain-containing protein [Saprospiraceae bacterium]
MTAASLISHEIIPLRTSHTGQEALDLMRDNNVLHLPIVNNKQLLGLVSEDDVLEHDVEEAIGSYQLSLNKPYARQDDHVFDVLAQVARLGLTVIPVIDQDDNYLGMISQHILLEFFSRSFSFAETGSIIVLEMKKPDYMLSEIARIIESENMAVLNSFITDEPQSNQILVHLKVNKQDVHRVIAAFERFDYRIKAMYSESENTDMYRDRIDALMNYLNI